MHRHFLAHTGVPGCTLVISFFSSVLNQYSHPLGGQIF
jgi:hypothetical protein